MRLLVALHTHPTISIIQYALLMLTSVLLACGELLESGQEHERGWLVVSDVLLGLTTP